MEDSQSSAREPALRIGQSPRLERAAALLEALARTLPGAAHPTRWHDVAELLLCGPRDRVLLDADHFPAEDIGIVRRFLAARPAARLEVIGSSRGEGAARTLLGLEGARWHEWPLELGELEVLLQPGGNEAPAVSLPENPAAKSAGEFDPRSAELRGPLADLLAQVRRTSDAHVVLRGSGGVDPAASEAFGQEIQRLERTVRGLVLGAERNARPAEDFDLDALVEEELAVLALQSRRAPRVRYQGGEVLPVRAERSALVHALEVLLELVRSLASTGELVEVRSLRESPEEDLIAGTPPKEAVRGSRALIRLRAPAGPLAGVAPAQLFQPSGLGERVGGFGPSELFALSRLCAARGLRLSARVIAGAVPQLEFELAVPIAERGAKLLAGTAATR